MDEDKFGSGSISNQGGFKYSTPQERFARQLDRDIKRDRLSQSTLRKLITDDTAQWARNIYAEKTAKNAAINVLNTQNQSKQIVGVVREFGGGVGSDTEVASGLIPTSTASASSSPVEFPDGGGEIFCALGVTRNNAGNIIVANGLIGGQNAGEISLGSGTGYICVFVKINQTNGTISNRGIVLRPSPPPEYFDGPDDQDQFWLILAEAFNSVVNYGCGSVYVQICRNWFAASPPYFLVNFFRS